MHLSKQLHHLMSCKEITMKIVVLLLTLFVSVMASNITSAEGAASVGVKATSDEMLLKKFQAAFKKKRVHSGLSLPLTAINISKDCSATTTCPNGTKLSCSIVGPSTSCGSDSTGVGCYTHGADGSVSGSGGTC